MKNREVKFIVTVQNNARQALKDLRDRLREAGEAGRRARRDLEDGAEGQRRLRRETDETSDAVQRQTGLLGQARSAVLGFLAAFGVGFLVQQADLYTNLSNRIAVVSETTAEAGANFGQLQGIAASTRSSLEATVQQFQRISQSQDALGISTQQTMQFITSLNQATVVSGASASEAAGGLLQLAQGLGAGVLQGEELNSVLENLPFVARIIADEVGVKTPAALKKLASEGLITSRSIIDAFLKRRAEIEKTFAVMAPTIGQGLQLLSDRFTIFWGELTTTSGLAQFVSNALVLLADNLDLVATAVAGAVIGFAALKAASIVQVLIGYAAAARAAFVAQTALNLALGAGSVGAARFAAATKLVSVAIRAVPVVGWAIALATALVALTKFTLGLKVAPGAAATLGDVASVAFQKLWVSAKQALGQAGEAIADFVKNTLNIDIDFSKINFRSIAIGAAQAADATVVIFKNLGTLLPLALDAGLAAVEVMFINLYNGVITGFINPALASIVEFLNSLPDLFWQTLKAVWQYFVDLWNSTLVTVNEFGAALWAWLQSVPTMFANAFESVKAAIVNKMTDAYNTVIGLFNMLPGFDIAPAVAAVGNTMLQSNLPVVAAKIGTNMGMSMSRGFELSAPQFETVEISAELAGRASGVKFNQALQSVLKQSGEGAITQFVRSSFEEAEKIAEARAAQANANAGGEGGAPPTDVAGKGSGSAKTKEASDAVKELAQRIQDLRDELFPAQKRLEEFSKKAALLSELDLTDEEKTAALARLNELYGIGSDAVGAFTRDLEDNARILGVAVDQQDEMAERIRLERALREDNGGVLSEENKKRIESALATRRQQVALEALQQLQRQNSEDLARIEIDRQVLLSGGTQREMDQMREVAQRRYDMLAAAGLAHKTYEQMSDEEKQRYAEIIALVQQYQTALGQLDAAQQAQQGNALAGLRDGLDQWKRNAQDIYGQVSDATKGLFEGLTNVMTDFLMTGKANFGDFARSVIQSILRIIVQALILRTVMALIPGLGGAAGGGGLLGTLFGGGDGGVLSAGVRHTGGMAGDRDAPRRAVDAAVFAHAARRHNGGMAGGLRAGEVPIIALENERILNPEETRAYNAGEAAGLARSSVSTRSGSMVLGQRETFSTADGVPVSVVANINNDFSALAKQSGLDEKQAQQASKQLEQDAKAFMEEWVQNEMRPGGRLDPNARRNRQ